MFAPWTPSADSRGVIRRGESEVTSLWCCLMICRLRRMHWQLPSDCSKHFLRFIDLGEHEVYSTASIGIALGDSRYKKADDVLRDADVAMYEAKRAGKARFVVFDETMRQMAQRQLRLEFDLHKAVDEQGLELEFEPIVSVSTGELSGVECTFTGYIQPRVKSPSMSLGRSQKNRSLIHAIGKWAIYATCQKMSEWIDELGPANAAFDQPNISHKQFGRRDFVQLVEKAQPRRISPQSDCSWNCRKE